MYEQKFNFSQRPFSVCPQTEEYFPGQSHQQAIDASRSCVQRRNGPATIIGAVGTGKSLTLQVIGEGLAGEFDVVSIECSRLEQRSELLQSILFGMNLPFRDMSEGELRLSLIDHLKNGNGNPNGILLLVDEADRLSIELLDELRLITNVVREGRSQAQLVLAGTQRLEESLNDPRLASFGQRIASRSYLQNFSREEVGDYIAENIQRAGSQVEQVFEEEAIDEVARSSDGCPRVINQLCERSLAVAAAQDRAKVTQDVVQIAWAELQNLPVPNNVVSSADTSNDFTGGDSSDSVVEFGSLDDERVSGSDFSNFDEQDQEVEVDSGPEQADGQLAGEHVSEVQEHTEVYGQPEGQEDSQVEGVSESDAPQAWSGQLPTNLGVTDFRSYGGGAAGFTTTTFGSGDPFAPEEESPPAQQFQYGSGNAFEAPSVSDFSSPQFDAPSTQEQEPEPVSAGSAGDVGDEVGDSSSQTFDSLTFEDQSFESESFSTEPEEQGQSTFQQQAEVQDDTVEPQADVVEVSADSSANDDFVKDDSENDVRAAFDGLGLIDQARSNAGVEAIEQPSVQPAIDPFAEDFEEEVLLQDAYSPFVAQQNKSSLSVTSEHLSHLTPNDEVNTAQDQTDSAPLDNEADSTGFSSTFTTSTEEPPTSYVPVQSVSTELRFPEPPLSTDSLENTEASQPVDLPQAMGVSDSVAEIDPDLAALTSDFSFDEETPSPASDAATYAAGTYLDAAVPADGAQVEDEIRGQTFDMAQNLRSAIESDQSPSTTDPFAQPTTGVNQPTSAQEQSFNYGTTDASEAPSANEPQAVLYPQQPPLDESQQVLREILAQQKIVNEGQFNQPQPPEQSVDSVSVEYPITDHDNYQSPSGLTNDDRDILRVNESQYTQSPQAQPEQPNPYADAEPSTGEAQRMDYGQLFDQLRNMPKQ